MDFDVLSTQCAPWVAPQTMSAIVKTESQFKPLAININGGAKLQRQPASKEEAIATAKWLLDKNYNFDLGLGQVNSANLAKTKLTVEDAFDPCKNLAASATILNWNFLLASKRTPDKQSALYAAISAYNTGSFTRGFKNGYVQKVVSNATQTVPAIAPNQQTVEPIPLVGAAEIKPKLNATKTSKRLKASVESSPLIDMSKTNFDMVKSTTKPNVEPTETAMKDDVPANGKEPIPTKSSVMVY